MSGLIFLDHNSVGSQAIEVIETIKNFFDCGSRVSAWEEMGKILDVDSNKIFFNSGASEGNTWIFLSVLMRSRQKRKKIVVSPLAPYSILEPAWKLRKFGYEIVELALTDNVSSIWNVQNA